MTFSDVAYSSIASKSPVVSDVYGYPVSVWAQPQQRWTKHFLFNIFGSWILVQIGYFLFKIPENPAVMFIVAL